MVADTRIDSPGTDEATWQAWQPLQDLPVLDVRGWDSAVVVAAHPDDEVLGAGGAMAALAASGARLRLIAVTDGEASHPGVDRNVLARQRADERSAALAALGAAGTEIIRLGLPDTGVAGHAGELASALAELCAGFEACLAPWDGDAHADHDAAGRAARRARADVLSYPIWMWHWAGPADPRVPWDLACQVPLGPEVAALKQAAIGSFASQLTPRPGGRDPVLPAAILAHFTRGAEVLLR